MELKKGMYYTRSKNGKLELCKCEGMTPEQYVETYKDTYNVKNASYNIAELLEVGDFLDNHYIDEIEDRTIYFSDGWFIDFDDVEDLVGTIVTKEMFESMSYKVEE